MSSQLGPLTAAEALEGHDLEGGWRVVSKLESHPDATGGCFSVGYEVVGPNGLRGFLKALDYAKGLGAMDPSLELQIMTAAFQYEKEILEKCARMTRVVSVLASGTARVSGFPVGAVSYLIFEWADGDVRRFLDTSGWLDEAVVLRSLHDVAVGLQQLHTANLAHRDLKPSNVLVLPSTISKLADLARASQGDRPDPLDPGDELLCAGDFSYAPPEALYGYRIPERRDRVRAGDLYLLGSLTLFMFERVSATAAIQAALHPDHRASAWGDGYAGVIPFLRQALDEVVVGFQEHLPRPIADDLAMVVRQLCDPEPSQRGHPAARFGGGNPFSIERYVAWFDLLRRRAELGVARAAS